MSFASNIILTAVDSLCNWIVLVYIGLWIERKRGVKQIELKVKELILNEINMHRHTYDELCSNSCRMNNTQWNSISERFPELTAINTLESWIMICTMNRWTLNVGATFKPFFYVLFWLFLVSNGKFYSLHFALFFLLYWMLIKIQIIQITHFLR